MHLRAQLVPSHPHGSLSFASKRPSGTNPQSMTYRGYMVVCQWDAIRRYECHHLAVTAEIQTIVHCHVETHIVRIIEVNTPVAGRLPIPPTMRLRHSIISAAALRCMMVTCLSTLAIHHGSSRGDAAAPLQAMATDGMGTGDTGGWGGRRGQSGRAHRAWRRVLCVTALPRCYSLFSRPRSTVRREPHTAELPEWCGPLIIYTLAHRTTTPLPHQIQRREAHPRASTPQNGAAVSSCCSANVQGRHYG